MQFIACKNDRTCTRDCYYDRPNSEDAYEGSDLMTSCNSTDLKIKLLAGFTNTNCTAAGTAFSNLITCEATKFAAHCHDLDPDAASGACVNNCTCLLASAPAMFPSG